MTTQPAFDMGPNQYGPDFGGRTPTALCLACDTPIARLSPLEWVDRRNNKANDVPRWHEHSDTRTIYFDGPV